MKPFIYSIEKIQAEYSLETATYDSATVIFDSLLNEFGGSDVFKQNRAPTTVIETYDN